MKQTLLKECRICFETEDDQQNELISPCICNGSLKYVHRDCLQKWRKTLPVEVFKNKRDIQCEICHMYYEFEDSYDVKKYKIIEYLTICLESMLYILLLHGIGFLLGILITWFGNLKSMVLVTDINIYLYQYLIGNIIVHIISGIISLCFILSRQDSNNYVEPYDYPLLCCISCDTSTCNDCSFCIIVIILFYMFFTIIGIYYWIFTRSKKRQVLKNDNRIVKNLDLKNIL